MSPSKGDKNAELDSLEKDILEMLVCLHPISVTDDYIITRYSLVLDLHGFVAAVASAVADDALLVDADG